LMVHYINKGLITNMILNNLGSMCLRLIFFTEIDFLRWAPINGKFNILKYWSIMVLVYNVLIIVIRLA